MSGGLAGPDHQADDRERSERRSFRIALAIALLPIPLALLVAWALGDPPWRPRPHREASKIAPADHPRGPAPPAGLGHP